MLRNHFVVVDTDLSGKTPTPPFEGPLKPPFKGGFKGDPSSFLQGALEGKPFKGP